MESTHEFQTVLFIAVLLSLHVADCVHRCPTFADPKFGRVICDNLFHLFCTPQCGEGYKFIHKPAVVYMCGPATGKWYVYPKEQQMPWPDCVKDSGHMSNVEKEVVVARSKLHQLISNSPFSLKKAIPHQNNAIFKQIEADRYQHMFNYMEKAQHAFAERARKQSIAHAQERKTKETDRQTMYQAVKQGMQRTFSKPQINTAQRSAIPYPQPRYQPLQQSYARTYSQAQPPLLYRPNQIQTKPLYSYLAPSARKLVPSPSNHIVQVKQYQSPSSAKNEGYGVPQYSPQTPYRRPGYLPAPPRKVPQQRLSQPPQATQRQALPQNYLKTWQQLQNNRQNAVVAKAFDHVSSAQVKTTQLRYQVQLSRPYSPQVPKREQPLTRPQVPKLQQPLTRPQIPKLQEPLTRPQIPKLQEPLTRPQVKNVVDQTARQQIPQARLFNGAVQVHGVLQVQPASSPWRQEYPYAQQRQQVQRPAPPTSPWTVKQQPQPAYMRNSVIPAAPPPQQYYYNYNQQQRSNIPRAGVNNRKTSITTTPKKLSAIEQAQMNLVTQHVAQAQRKLNEEKRNQIRRQNWLQHQHEAQLQVLEKRRLEKQKNEAFKQGLDDGLKALHSLNINTVLPKKRYERIKRVEKRSVDTSTNQMIAQ